MTCSQFTLKFESCTNFIVSQYKVCVRLNKCVVCDAMSSVVPSDMMAATKSDQENPTESANEVDDEKLTWLEWIFSEVLYFYI